jgi:hypothetical protein
MKRLQVRTRSPAGRVASRACIRTVRPGDHDAADHQHQAEKGDVPRIQVIAQRQPLNHRARHGQQDSEYDRDHAANVNAAPFQLGNRQLFAALRTIPHLAGVLILRLQGQLARRAMNENHVVTFAGDPASFIVSRSGGIRRVEFDDDNLAVELARSATAKARLMFPPVAGWANGAPHKH